jgi:hypothetical protein
MQDGSPTSLRFAPEASICAALVRGWCVVPMTKSSAGLLEWEAAPAGIVAAHLDGHTALLAKSKRCLVGFQITAVTRTAPPTPHIVFTGKVRRVEEQAHGTIVTISGDTWDVQSIEAGSPTVGDDVRVYVEQQHLRLFEE